MVGKDNLLRRLAGIVEGNGHSAASAKVGNQSRPEADHARAFRTPNAGVNDPCRSGRQQCLCEIL